MLRNAPKWAKFAFAVLWLSTVVIIFIGGSSFLFVKMGHLQNHYPYTSFETYYQWLAYLPYRHKLVNKIILIASGSVTALLIGAVHYAIIQYMGGWRRIKQSQLVTGQVLRGASLNHDDARYMEDEEIEGLFPSTPDLKSGTNVVVGERDRVDLGPVAHIPFDPTNRLTWGNGGKALLMFDHCKTGSTHSMIIGGSGTFKSVTLATTLLYWQKSCFCLDPKAELADLVGEAIERSGRKVVRLSLGGQGPNVLDAIDINDPMAETRLRSVVGRIVGPIVEGDKDSRWKKWGKTIITALLAHLMWSDDIAPELKTLRTLRAGLTCGTDRTRLILRGIGESSPSQLARDCAMTMWDLPHETFASALGNSTDDTEWLSSVTYGNLVSGSAYKMSELAEGNLCVFCQVPLEALEHTPAVARVLTGCHLDAVFAAKGNVNGRVFFPLDEAVLLGRDPALKIARDQGRDSLITLSLYYQSDAQIDEVWTPAGRRAWFDSLSWRSYSSIGNLDSAKEISATLGTFGARAFSYGNNKGASSRIMEWATRSAGTNINEHEISHQLATPYKLLTGMRGDERITIPRGRRGIRHGAAISFRRAEIVALLRPRQRNVTKVKERESV